MLQDIRENMQGTMAKVIIGIMIVPFALFGIDSIFSGGGGVPTAATVNGEEISQNDLLRAIQIQKNQILSRMGENADPNMISDELLKGPALDRLIQQRLVAQAAQAYDIAISDARLDSEITSTPNFQIDGEFDKDVYRDLLSGSGLTPTEYRNLLRKDSLAKQLSSGFAATGFVTEAEMKIAAGLAQQTRDFEYITLSVEDEKEKTDVSAEEVKEYYDSRSGIYQTQEQVELEYLEISRADILNSISVTEDEIKEQFEQELQEFETKQNRRVSHILIESGDQEKADAIKVRIDAGEDFAAVAKELSDDIGSKNSGGDLGYSQGDAFPEEFEEAIAKLSVDQVGQVKTDSGIHIVKLTEFTQTEPPKFEDIRARIENDLKTVQVDSLYIERVEQLKDISFNASDLNEPAAEMELKVQNSGLFTRSVGTGIAAESKVRTAAFGEDVLKEGNNSDVIEVGESAIVIRVKEHQKPRQQTLEEVNDKVVEAVKTNKAKAVVKKRVDDIMAELASGTALDEISKRYDYRKGSLKEVKRVAADADREVVEKAFAMAKPTDKPTIEKLTLRSANVAIIVLSKVAEGDIESMEENEKNGLARYLTSISGRADYAAFEDALKKKAAIER